LTANLPVVYISTERGAHQPRSGNFPQESPAVFTRIRSTHNKIGNAHLKWAFSEAAVLFLRQNEPAQLLHQKLVSKYGKAKALSIIAQKPGRVIYFMLMRRVP
jgi:hypothetical protein